MLKMIKNISKKISGLFVASIVSIQCYAVDIPVSSETSEQATSGDWFGWLSSIMNNFYTLVLGVIGMAAFAYVAWGALMAFIEWRQGKAEFGEMMTKVGIAIGVLVVVLVILQVAKAFVGG